MAENQFGIGKPVRRKEDGRLLTGHGRYTVDIDIPGQARAVFLRSRPSPTQHTSSASKLGASA